MTPDGKEAWTASNQAHYRGHSVLALPDGYQLTLTWDSVQIGGASYPAKVQATVTLRDHSLLTGWRIHVQNQGPASVGDVVFPLVSSVKQLGRDSADDVLIYPSRQGLAFPDPLKNLPGWKQLYPSSWLAMQFMAYLDDRAGFYFAAHDPNGNIKAFAWEPKVWNGSLNIVHYPPLQFGAGFLLPYEVVLGAFTGDWSTAADLYKDWARRQPWAQVRPEEKRTPAWLAGIGVGAEYFTGWPAQDLRWRQKDELFQAFKSLIPNARQHQETFALPSVLRVFGWERGGIWSSGDYFPALGDWAKFDELVGVLHGIGARLWLFVDAQALEVDAEPWATGEAQSSALRDKDGKPVVRLEPGFPEPHALMDPGTAYWQEKLKEYVVTLVKRGVDLVQLDGLPWRSPMPCYDVNHGHPPGLGGSWQTSAWLNLLASVRRTAQSASTGVALSGEGGAEVYIPYLDVYHSRDTWQVEQEIQSGARVPIPLFQYVYGNRIFVIAMHNAPLNLRTSAFNRYGFARALTWGSVPYYSGLQILQSPSLDRETLAYVKRIAEARSTYLRPFLLEGQMARPLRLVSPTTDVRSDWQYLPGAQTPVTFQLQVPALQHSVWRAPDGSLAFLFTNISNGPVSIDFPIELEPYGIERGKTYQVTLWRNGDPQPLSWPPVSGFSILVHPLEIVSLTLASQ